MLNCGLRIARSPARSHFALRNSQFLLVLALLFSYFSISLLPLSAEPGVLRNPTEACRRLAQDLQKRAPSITHHNVHWLFGMDISGSMRGGRLDSAKEMLRQWVTYVVVPGDRITLAAFDDEVRLFGPWEVGSDKAPLLTSLLDPLSVRFRPGGGSALQDVREKLLSVAAADTDKERAPITLLITDRDDPDAMPREDNFSRRLVERYGGQFTANAEQKNEDAIEGQVPVSILKPSGQGITYLVVIVSVATRASALPAKSGMEPRRIPLAEPVTMRHEGHDPAAGLRAFLALVPWIVLAVTAVLAAWLWTAGRAGRLVGDTQHGNLILPWRPFRQPPRNIPASRDAARSR